MDKADLSAKSENAQQEAIRLLKSLEKIFPADNFISSRWTSPKEHNAAAYFILKENKLIEAAPRAKVNIPGEGIQSIVGYRITPLGMEFLNGLKQQRTNRWLFWLTTITVIIGTIQIIISLCT